MLFIPKVSILSEQCIVADMINIFFFFLGGGGGGKKKKKNAK